MAGGRATLTSWESLNCSLSWRSSGRAEALRDVEYNYRPTPWTGTEAPGISVFVKEGERIYHTYSTYKPGLDMLNVAYHYIDLVPKGRDEGEGGLGEWVHCRDEYPDA